MLYPDPSGEECVEEQGVAQQPQPNVHQLNEQTLIQGVKSGRANLVKNCLAAGLSADMQEDGVPVILTACRKKHWGVVKALLQHNANPDVSGADKMTVLHYACQEGNAKVVNLAIEKKAKIEAENLRKETPLHLACRDQGLVPQVVHGQQNLQVDNSGRLGIVKCLVAKKANVLHQDQFKRTPLHIAAMENAGILRVLLTKTNKVDLLDQEKQTPLHYAAGKNAQSVELLLKANAKPDLQDKLGNTPLHEAVTGDHVEAVSKLLEHQDINANIPNKDGETPFHIAVQCINGNSKMAMMLMNSKKVDKALTTFNKDKQPIGHLIVAAGAAPVLQELFLALKEKGHIDLKAKDAQDRGLLHLAIEKKKNGMIPFLMGQRVKLNDVDKLGLTPVEYAHCFQNLVAVGFLNKKGIKLKDLNDDKLNRMVRKNYQNLREGMITLSKCLKINDIGKWISLLQQGVDGKDVSELIGIKKVIMAGIQMDVLSRTLMLNPLFIFIASGNMQGGKGYANFGEAIYADTRIMDKLEEAQKTIYLSEHKTLREFFSALQQFGIQRQTRDLPPEQRDLMRESYNHMMQ